MQNKHIIATALCAGILSLSLAATRAQTVWNNSAGGDWNTAANWNPATVPGVSTNAYITNSAALTVTCTAPMTAASIGSLTLGGFGADVLTLSAGGFNVAGTTTLNASGTLNVNSGAVMTNATLNMAKYTSAASVNSGGTMTNTTTSVSNDGSNDGAPLKINGGNVNLGTATIRRSGATIFSSGLTILGGNVSATSVTVGSGSANSYCTMSVGGAGSGGTLNVSGNLTIGNSSSVTVGRAYQYLQTNGTVTCQGNLVMGAAGTGSKNFFTVNQTAVFNAVGVVLFPNSVSSITNNFTNAAAIYLGNGGFTLPNSGGTTLYNVSLNGGGVFGASASWTGSMNAVLPSGLFTFSPADSGGNGHTITMYGSMSGGGGLLVTNAGTLVLANTNSYTGNTTIYAGSTLQLGDGINTNGVVAGYITNNGALIVANPNSQTMFATNIIGSGSLAKNGAGTLILNGTNNSINGATISAGTLQLGDGVTTSGAIPGTITDNGTLAVANPTAQTLANVVTGSGSLAKNGAGTLTLGANETYAGSTLVNAGSLVVPSGSSITSTQSVTIASGGLLDVSASTPGGYTLGSGYAFTAGHTSGSDPDFKGNLTSYGTIAVTNAATLTLNGNLSLNNGGTAVFNLGTTPSAGSTIALTGGAALSLSGTTTVQLNFAVLGVGTYPLISGASSVSGGLGNLNPIFNGALGAYTASLQVTATGVNLVVAGTPHNLVWQGDGYANSWDNNTGNIDWSNTVTHAVDNFAAGYYVTFDNTGAANQPILNAVVSPATTTINGSSSYTFSGGGSINTGSLTNNSTGTLYVQTANTYNGGTTINAGTVEVDAGGAIGTGPVVNNAALTFNNAGGNNAAAITGSGAVTVENGPETLAAANTYAGGTTINSATLTLGTANAVPGGAVAGDVTLNGTLDLAGFNDLINGLSGSGTVDTIEGGTPTLTVGGNGDSGTFSGIIQNSSGTLNLAKAGSGTQTLGNVNTYSGNTIISNGVLQLAVANALPTGTTVILGGSGTAGALDLDGFSQQVAGLALGGGAANIGQIIGNSGSSAATLIFTNGGTSIFGGTIQDVLGSGTSTVALTVNGGALVLNGTNNYSGATIVNAAQGGNTMFTVSGGLLSGTTLTLNTYNGSRGFFVAGGTASFSGNVVFSADNANYGNLMQVTNGVLNASNVLSGRCGLSLTTQPTTGQTTSDGIYVNNPASVNITNLLRIGGYNAGGNSSASFRMDGGTVNVGGTARITINNSGRWSVLDINGGVFTSTDATGAGIQIGGGYGGASAIMLVRAGKVSADTITFGDGAQTNGTDVLSQTGGSLYLGSGGIVSGSNAPTYLETITLSSGTVGALANWSSSLPMTLSGTMTFQAADGNSNPFNIALNGALSGGSSILNKTGGGTLTLGAADTCTGDTYINAGTLAIGAGGSISSPSILLGANTTFDVSQATGGFTLGGSQTIRGFGTVTGLVAAASGSIIYPGSNVVTGTLTFTSGLTETGGAFNTFNLSTNLSAASNDLLSVSGALTVSGGNTVLINGAVQAGGVYPIISYAGGTFTGSTANFTVSGASGSLSNSSVAQTIYFVAQSSVRSPTSITWLGNPLVNNWDSEITTNWLNNGTGLPDIFVPGDNALFSNLGAGNPLVNLVGTVTPGSVTVSTSSSYTFGGTGSIGGTGGLVVSNGIVTVLTTNNYTGQTILAGGVLITPVIANSGSPSGIGAATSDPGNLIFNGGTLAYSGASVGTDHNLTLTNAGGTIDVTNGTTLTLNGTLSGNGSLTKVDNGTLVLANAAAYTGNTTIGGGVLQINNAASANGTINFSNGVLAYYPGGGITVANPFTFTAGTTNMIMVTSGGGGNPVANGAWSGSGLLIVSNTFLFTANGNLDSFTGTIEVADSAGFRFNSGGGNTCYGSTNATFNLGTSGALLNRNGGTMNLGALEGAPGSSLQGQDADNGTTVWSIGNNNLSTSFAGIISDNNSGRLAAVTKVGSGTLTLSGANTCSGAITVSSGTLLVNGSIIGANGAGAVTVGGGTLGGSGTLGGAVTVQTGGTFAPGAGTNVAGTVLTINNTLTLNSGSTNFLQVSHNNQTNDSVTCSGAIAYSGTLTVVTNAGDAPLASGDTFLLFNSTSASYSGGFTAFNLPPLSAGLAWNTGNLTVNGTISVVSATPPSLSSILVSGANITLTSTNGSAGGQVIVLTTTNLTLPVNQWTPLTTNNYDGTGSFSYTITGAVTSGLPQQFYRLQTQ